MGRAGIARAHWTDNSLASEQACTPILRAEGDCPTAGGSCLDPSVAQANLPRRRVRDLVLVRHHNQRHPPLLLNSGQNLHDARRVDAVQVSGRLVGQQNLRLVGQRARNRHPLPLARGELIGILPQAVFQAHLAAAEPPPVRRACAAGAQGQHRHLHIFKNAQRGHQMKCLEDESDLLER